MAAITDIRSYTDIETDSLPRFLVRTDTNKVFLDTGDQVGSLSGNALGASMIPFRPNASPQPWMYIGVAQDYKKYSVPGFFSPIGVYEYNVGIRENQYSVEACPNAFNFTDFSDQASGWQEGGVAGAPSDTTRVSDTAGDVLEDPASGDIKRCSVEVDDEKAYQIGMVVVFDAMGSPKTTIVEDVIPPISPGEILEIESIYYLSGDTGRCVIVPTRSAVNKSVPTFTGNVPTASSIYSDNAVAGLRRGSILRLDNGSDTPENVLILSVTTGPSGTICFECVTVATYAAAATSMAGIPAIVVSQIDATYAGKSIGSADMTSTFSGPGEGTLDQDLSDNPFDELMAPGDVAPQQNDYVGISLSISDLSKFTRGTLIFSTEPSTAAYDKNGFYLNFGPNDLTLITSLTPTIEDQYYLLAVPISQLQRMGNDWTRTLANCNGVRLSIEVIDAVDVRYGSLFVGGGGQPDVGLAGAPYFYTVVGRNSQTGARSNPSPIVRYGVGPRRQSVNVIITDGIDDDQVDIWDVYRFGGTINSWRYIGSIANTSNPVSFTDNFYDTAAEAGSLIEYDNFQPWPSLDIPFQPIVGTVAGVTTAITITGTEILLVFSSATPFGNPFPSIERFLPGNLAIVNGQNAYTLRSRPVAVTLDSPPDTYYYAFLFEFVQNIGAPTAYNILIREPAIARQTLPYLWGPDAAGTVFACGDDRRAGTVYFAKSNAPDSAPDTYNMEVTDPSEPLLGGEVMNGLSFVASSSRWWGLLPNFGDIRKRYQPVEKPVGRGLAAPFGHCTDGKRIFFVAKDGIWTHSGGPGQCITDDLSNLFPQEGVSAVSNYTYGGYTVYAPDYQYAAEFRLRFCNGYLYFDYRDSTNTPRTLTCDFRDPENPAWIVDSYADPITCHYAPEQPESSLLSTAATYPMLLMGDANGKVHVQSEGIADNGTSISGAIATMEYNAGDIRKNNLFDDAFFDVVPVSGISVAAVSAKSLVTAYAAYAASAARVRSNLPIGLELPFCGILIKWVTATGQAPTILNAWQPMYQGVPVKVFLWKTQKSALGYKGFKHLRQWDFCYRASAAVTITVTAYDGTSPTALTLPSTGDVVKKVMFPFTYNKGLLFDFVGTSSAEWAPYLSESDLYVGDWERDGEYRIIKDIEAPMGVRS